MVVVSPWTKPDDQRHPDYVPTLPSTQTMPKQESGIRPARPVPYELQVGGVADAGEGAVRLRFENSGALGAVFQVRSGDGQTGPWR